MLADELLDGEALELGLVDNDTLALGDSDALALLLGEVEADGDKDGDSELE